MPNLLTTFLCSMLYVISVSMASDSKEISLWIEQLGSPSLRSRQQAEKLLWQAGPLCQSAVDSASKSPNPEIALRAAKIARYLALGLTPDSPPEIIELAQSFSTQSITAKLATLKQLRQQKRYQLALQLYQQEQDESTKVVLRSSIQGLSIMAAREALIQGDHSAARQLLTDFSDDPRNPMALAWMAHSSGQLEEEITKAQKSPSPDTPHYLIALLRLKGDLKTVTKLAENHKLPELAAAMRLLEGEPEPWLNWQAEHAQREVADITQSYAKIVQHRLHSRQLGPANALSLLQKIAQKEQDYTRRWSAIQAMLSLGIETPTYAILQNLNPPLLFQYHTEQEKIDEALVAFGLDPKAPDYNHWIDEKLQAIINEEDEHEMDSLPTMISFLEKRGIREPIEQHFIPRMLALADTDQERFTDLLSLLFSEQGKARIAPFTATKIASAYAKDDDLLWGSMIRIAFSENPFFSQWWQWLGEMEPQASRATRFRHLMILFRGLPDHDSELPTLEKLIRQSLKDQDQEVRETRRKLLNVLSAISHVTPYALWSCEQMGELDADNLMNLGEWKMAAEKWDSSLKANPENVHALLWSALCWRRAGQAERATQQEKTYESLVLGDTNMMIAAASIYQHLGDAKTARAWRELVLRTGARNEAWHLHLYLLAEEFLLEGKWQQAHAYYEAFSLFSLSHEEGSNLSQFYRTRKKADMARGLSLYAKQPKIAIQILRDCHQSLKADASLADQFFPALRLIGAQKEHDAWFEESWQQLLRIRDRFPLDDNVRNSAAWLAARALKRLDDAQKEAQQALRLRPNQAAYLDTMAEIFFAQGNRSEAMAWSEKALEVEPHAASLRDQYFRFRTEPFPR